MGGQRDNQATLPSGKTRYQLNSRLGGSQGQSGKLRKISTLQGLESRLYPVLLHNGHTTFYQ
jgi:hypothetical protein